MNASKNISAGALALLVFLGGGLTQTAADTGVELDNPNHFEIEVAEDGTRFVYDEAPVFDDGYPEYGNGFVTQGYIYPEGTLNGSNGVNPDGTPEFPESVIGEWTCYGYFVGDGAHTEEGAWVVTTQVFELESDTVGGETIVTVGFETPAGAGTAMRSVVGGSGRWAHTSGEVAQVTLGHNTSDGVNATFSFDLRGARKPIAPSKESSIPPNRII